jgi:hypothetical protein
MTVYYRQVCGSDQGPLLCSYAFVVLNVGLRAVALRCDLV